MKTLLLVEDERDILENNRKFFAAEGYCVLTAENLAQARKKLAKETPGAIVLDIMLPDGNGLDLLSELRAAGSKIPVIMLTAWGKSSDVTHGLKLGANDYMSKPFTYDVLLARVEAMFRNVEQVPEMITRGSLTLKLTPREAYVDGADLMLTPKEYLLLQFFVQNEDCVMAADYVYENVWGRPMASDPQALITTVSRLRKKLTGCGYTISSKYRNGYCFESEEL